MPIAGWWLIAVCPLDGSEHIAVAFDPVVADLILNAPDPTNATTVHC